MRISLVQPLLNFSYTMLLIISPGVFGQKLSLKLYNVNDGLPSNSIQTVYQDKYGYLWVSTAGGLSRFDGRQFVNYGISDGLPSLTVGRVFQDSRERLWVGTFSGMAQFKNNRFLTYPTNDRFKNPYVYNFAETGDKRIWALTDQGVYEFTDSIWNKVSLFPGLENSPCRNIIETNGELYVNYPNDIFCKNKEGKWIHIATQSFFNVMSLQNNQIWISTRENIYEIKSHKLIPLYKRKIGVKNYFSYLVDSKKRLWLGGNDFLKTSMPADWQHFSDSINNYTYNSFISEDSSHNIWTGTSEGLLKLKDIDFIKIDKNKTAPLDGIYNMIALPDNKLIFSSGTKTGLQLYVDNCCKQIMPPKTAGNKNYYKDPVDAFTFDNKNSLWMVTRFRKFLRFNGKTLEDFSGAFHFNTTELIYGLDYIKNRKQFFVCADSTLLFGDTSNFKVFIPENTGIPIVKPTRVHGIKNGLIVLYIEKQGVYFIDSLNRLIPLVMETDGSEKGLHLGRFFYEDLDNSFWIAIPGLGLYEYDITRNNLLYLKNHISTKEGLQSNNVRCLANDKQKRLWVATNSGIDILQKDKVNRWEVFNFVKGEDLTINENDYERLVCDIDGNIWLSSPNKVIKFTTPKILLHKETPHIIIEKVSIGFRETDWSKLTDSLYSYYQLPYNPVLNYNQNSLGIFFDAVNLSIPNSNPEYSYKLLPIDTVWSEDSKSKSVSFAQLPWGKYLFMVRTREGASGWSSPAMFPFTITSPFWKRWWFRLIIIAITSFIIILLFRLRISTIKRDAFLENQLKELEMKALKAQMNPHFIYNALNSIQALVANGKKKESIYYIGSFSRLLRQVLDNSENNVISLDRELETINFYIQLETLRLDMKLKYIKIISDDIVPEFEKIPPLILQPFVENALWHGLDRKEGDKEIKITVSAEGEWLICDITDNGIGRQKANEWKINSVEFHQSKGIEITQKRLTDFNENNLVSPIGFTDLYDDKNTPSGTRVIIHIKRKIRLPLV
jgi:ligand-binding sensor domain-containing protein